MCILSKLLSANIVVLVFFVLMTLSGFVVFVFRFAKFFDKANINKTIAAKDRINLLYEILSRTSYSKYLKESSIFCGNENDAKIGIERLIADGTFLAAYPLHESFGEINGRKTNRQVSSTVTQTKN